MRLKKQLTKKAITRVRNIVKGKGGDKLGIQSGYNAHVQNRQCKRTEGDVWEEHGKKWTIQNGIKINISKFDNLREKSFVPYVCPKCNQALNTGLQKHIFKLRGHCYTCQMKEDEKCKEDGTFTVKQFERVLNNLESELHENMGLFDKIVEENVEQVGEFGNEKHYKFEGDDFKKNIKKERIKYEKQVKEYIKEQRKKIKKLKDNI